LILKLLDSSAEKIFPILVPVVANTSNNKWGYYEKMIYLSTYSVGNTKIDDLKLKLNNINPVLYEKYKDITDSKYKFLVLFNLTSTKYLLQDVKLITEERKKVEAKWQDVYEQAKANGFNSGMPTSKKFCNLE